LFLYSDFILRGNSANQVVQIGANGNGDTTVVQTMATFPSAKNNFVVNSALQMEVEAALLPHTLNDLTTLNGVLLNNNLNSGPGSATWALEWDFTIAPNSSTQISALDNLQVPEPSSIALVLLGFGAWTWRRQRSPG
jgi:hypothetical protein